jgi:hypothetical protein
MLIDFNYSHEPVEGTFPFPGVGPLALVKESRINHFGKMACLVVALCPHRSFSSCLKPWSLCTTGNGSSRAASLILLAPFAFHLPHAG